MSETSMPTVTAGAVARPRCRQCQVPATVQGLFLAG
jgi:hypothetical protein